MKTFILWFTVSGLLFVGFAAMLIAGLVRRRRSLVMGSLVVLLLSGGAVVRTIWFAADKSLDKVAGLFHPRTGMDIYYALFGKPGCDCVRVVRTRDAEIPVIDAAVWIEVQTCPEELERILRQHPYREDESALCHFYPTDEGFDPAALGDDLRVYRWERDDAGSVQVIYASADSTKMLCADFGG